MCGWNGKEPTMMQWWMHLTPETQAALATLLLFTILVTGLYSVLKDRRD
jgi:hypothetical protein